MTKFERNGVDRQQTATNKWQAIKQFNRSCEMCCCMGLHIDCNRCAIQEVHKILMKEVFDAKKD